jgi:thymidylate synthase (FAD)
MKMKLIQQSWKYEQPWPDNTYELIERAGRTCYQSHGKNPEEFCRMIFRNGHHSVLEHVSCSLRIKTSRAVSHELVRHRLCSFSQESQRYVRYNDIEFIIPEWFDLNNYKEVSSEFTFFCDHIEQLYKTMLKNGLKSQEAREILPNCTVTELVMTANLREWIHICSIRTAKGVYPQTKTLFEEIKYDFRSKLPIFFGE